MKMTPRNKMTLHKISYTCNCKNTITFLISSIKHFMALTSPVSSIQHFMALREIYILNITLSKILFNFYSFQRTLPNTHVMILYLPVYIFKLHVSPDGFIKKCHFV